MYGTRQHTETNSFDIPANTPLIARIDESVTNRQGGTLPVPLTPFLDTSCGFVERSGMCRQGRFHTPPHRCHRCKHPSILTHSFPGSHPRSFPQITRRSRRLSMRIIGLRGGENEDTRRHLSPFPECPTVTRTGSSHDPRIVTWRASHRRPEVPTPGQSRDGSGCDSGRNRELIRSETDQGIFTHPPRDYSPPVEHL
jgi:hypothetical protein